MTTLHVCFFFFILPFYDFLGIKGRLNTINVLTAHFPSRFWKCVFCFFLNQVFFYK